MLVEESGDPVALAQAAPKDGMLRWMILRGLWQEGDATT